MEESKLLLENSLIEINMEIQENAEKLTYQVSWK
nr:MAG TPA: hypothetical protein [Caudoviricetes sp.]